MNDTILMDINLTIPFLVEGQIHSQIAVSPVIRNLTHRGDNYKFLYKSLCTYFLSWYLPVVIFVGSFGTAFCFAFIFKSGLFTKSLTVWLVSICAGDFMILLCDASRIMLKVLLNYDIRDTNDFFCKMHYFTSQYAMYWSSYMQTCMSLQRLYSVLFPLKARSQLTMRRLWSIWMGISIFLLFPQLVYLVYWEVQDGNCDPTQNDVYFATSLSDAIVWGTIPLCIMTTATIGISWKMMVTSKTSFHSFTHGRPPHTQQKKRSFIFTKDSLNMDSIQRSSLAQIPWAVNGPPRTYNEADSSQQSTFSQAFPQSSQYSTTLLIKSSIEKGASGSTPTEDMSKSRVDICNETVRRPYSCPGRKHGGASSSRSTKTITRLLLVMNLWYLLTTFPYMIYLLYLNFVLGGRVGIDIATYLHKFLYNLLRSLCYMNSCSNWFFYCVSGSIFRQRAKEMLLRYLCHRKYYSAYYQQQRSHTNMLRSFSVSQMGGAGLLTNVTNAVGGSSIYLHRNILNEDGTPTPVRRFREDINPGERDVRQLAKLLAQSKRNFNHLSSAQSSGMYRSLSTSSRIFIGSYR